MGSDTLGRRGRSLRGMFSRKDKMQMVGADEALPGHDHRVFAVPSQHFVNFNPLEPPFPDGLEQAIFGLGCFWGAERKFWETPGVFTTAVGYAGGHSPNPTYEEVCSGRTGHTEAVLVVFDPKQVSYEQLLKVFWEAHNPTQGMRQGNDVGTQYRSAIYTFTPEQRAAAVARPDWEGPHREQFDDRFAAAQHRLADCEHWVLLVRRLASEVLVGAQEQVREAVAAATRQRGPW